MKKILVTMIAFTLTIAAQADKIDSTQFVAFYNYTIQTQDDEGQNVTDSIRLALLVGTRATYCTTVLAYNRDGRASSEMMNAFIMHHQNVLTDVEKSEVTALEPIYPYRYLSKEPLAKVDWTLDEDTLAIGGLLCHRATGKLYGKLWTVWYTEEMPSSAGPWKLRGLPGLIVKAEDSEGIHCFELYGTKNEVRGIGTLDHPELQKLSRPQGANVLCGGRTRRFWRDESQWCRLLFCQPHACSPEEPCVSAIRKGMTYLRDIQRQKARSVGSGRESDATMLH